MKNYLSILAVLFLLGCGEHWHSDYAPQTNYEPVIVNRDDLAATIKVKPPRSINNAGKIYRQGDLLFINEMEAGIHIIDNVDPKDPKQLAFLEVPGNVNLSMYGDIMYVDHASDLVTLRYNESGIEELDRNKDAFPEKAPPDTRYIPHQYTKEQRPENTVILKWIEK